MRYCAGIVRRLTAYRSAASSCWSGVSTPLDAQLSEHCRDSEADVGGASAPSAISPRNVKAPYEILISRLKPALQAAWLRAEIEEADSREMYVKYKMLRIVAACEIA